VKWGFFLLHRFFALFPLKNVSFLKRISFAGDAKNEAELAKSLCLGTGIFCAVGEKTKNGGKTLLKIHVPHGRFYVEMRRFFIYNIKCYQVKIDEERF